MLYEAHCLEYLKYVATIQVIVYCGDLKGVQQANQQFTVFQKLTLTTVISYLLNYKWYYLKPNKKAGYLGKVENV